MSPKPGALRAPPPDEDEAEEEEEDGEGEETTSRPASADFMRLMTPSPALAAVIGAEPMPRTEVVKRLWTYIKKNGLQDRKDVRMIRADDALRPIFRADRISMFEMTKKVNEHLS